MVALASRWHAAAAKKRSQVCQHPSKVEAKQGTNNLQTEDCQIEARASKPKQASKLNVVDPHFWVIKG